MSFSSQSLVGVSSTFMFFFSEKFVKQHFQEVEADQGDPQPGDLYLFQLQSPKAEWFRGAHVGVYCGHGEIIHFEGRNSSRWELGRLLKDCDGMVHKEGLHSMRQSRKLLRVLRKRDGIDPKVLEHRVQKAMNSSPPRYHPISSNCVHFALNLLDMDSASIESSCTYKFFPEEPMSQDFQAVKLDQGSPQPGDLYLFQPQNLKKQWFGVHVGVYCGHEEIIHFEGRTSSSGVVSKQYLSDMRHCGQLLHVLRKCNGVDPKVLEHQVQKAMNSGPSRYHPISSNCVHFALNLLSMDSMTMDLDLNRD